MFSVFGAMTGSMLAAPRVYFAMARDGCSSAGWATSIRGSGTPHRAIVLQAIWASVLVWSGTYRQLFTRVIFTEWIFFALMAGGIFLLRRRPGYAPAYRVWGYPVGAGGIRRRVRDDRRQSAGVRAARQRWPGSRWSASACRRTSCGPAAVRHAPADLRGAGEHRDQHRAPLPL